MERFLCIAGQARGHQFLLQAAELGVHAALLTLDGLRDAGWPGEALEDLATMPAGLTREQILNTVTWMARGRQYDRIVALDDGELLGAAELREHLRIPGMGRTTAGYYRDRLAMALSARESGFACPEFARVLNYDELREFMERVPAPWVLKLRARQPNASQPDEIVLLIDDAEHLWRQLDELGDRQSRYVLQKPLEGTRYTVESIVSECRVVFSVVLRHTPLAGGGMLIETLDRSSRAWMEISALNGGLAPSLGMVRGVTEASFVESAADGRYYFEEIAAGVGSDLAAEVTEAASGLNLWREWARLEVAHLRGQDYVPNEWFGHYAAALDWPTGTLGADVEELAARELVNRHQACGREWVLLRSARLEPVERLARGLSQRLSQAAAGTR